MGDIFTYVYPIWLLGIVVHFIFLTIYSKYQKNHYRKIPLIDAIIYAGFWPIFFVLVLYLCVEILYNRLTGID